MNRRIYLLNPTGQRPRNPFRLFAFLVAGLVVAVIGVAALHAQDDPPPVILEPPAEIDWKEPLPGKDDWNGPGMIVWQRADLEADRMQAEMQREQWEAIESQTAAIMAQTEAITRLAKAQEQTAANIAALTDAVQNINFQGTFVMPEAVAESLVPALDAIRNWIEPQAPASGQ